MCLLTKLWLCLMYRSKTKLTKDIIGNAKRLLSVGAFCIGRSPTCVPLLDHHLDPHAICRNRSD